MGGRETPDPRLREQPALRPHEREPAREREHEGVQREQEGRGGAQRGARDSQLEADRGADAERTEERQHREGRGAPVAPERPRHPLHGAEEEDREAEPVPLLPEEHRHGRDAGGEEQGEHAEARRGGEDRRRGQGADDAERADRPRLPADGERRGARAHGERKRQAGSQPEHAVDLRGDHEGHERGGERGADHHERRLGPAAPLVEPDPEREHDERARGGQSAAQLVPDPASGEGEGKEEDEADEHRRASDPGEDATAEEVLERPAGRVGRRGSRDASGRLRDLGRRRDRARERRRGRAGGKARGMSLRRARRPGAGRRATDGSLPAERAGELDSSAALLVRGCGRPPRFDGRDPPGELGRRALELREAALRVHAIRSFSLLVDRRSATR